MKGLPRIVKEALQKARESAMLAVEIYNKPAVSFKSSGYITMMIIAWTSLFHAIFFRKKIRPYYREDELRPKGRFKKVDGDYKHWELSECLNKYYKSESGNPVRKNIEFFIPLRNRIEHRSIPEIDSTIFGECQALLLNFDSLLEKEFGIIFCIRQSLSFALQMYPSSSNLAEAVKKNNTAKSTADFIEMYRSSISTDILQSSQYAFKAFLIKVANHESKDALAIQFINYDILSAEGKENVDRIALLLKTIQVPATIANVDNYRAGDVVKRVKEKLGNVISTGSGKQIKINMSWHTKCWKEEKVRPEKGAPNPEHTKTQYCIYDKRHDDYGYTEDWVKLLIKKLESEKDNVTLL